MWFQHISKAKHCKLTPLPASWPVKANNASRQVSETPWGTGRLFQRKKARWCLCYSKGRKFHGVCVDSVGSSYSAPATLSGVESRRAGGEKAGRWRGTLDMSLERAELERDLDPHVIISNPVYFYAISLSIWLINQCSPQPGSAKAGSVSGNGKGMLCFSKDFSTAVTHVGQKEPTCTRHYRFFE